MSKKITASALNAAVAQENFERANAGLTPLPAFAIPCGFLPRNGEARVYRYSQGDVEVTVHDNGVTAVYYAPTGVELEYLPTHREHAFNHAADLRAHLDIIKWGGYPRIAC